MFQALGNLGPVAQKYDERELLKRLHFERELLRCSNNDKVTFNISLSAVQALRRFNMSTVSSFVINGLKETMLAESVDVEIRIATYLIYMKADPSAAELVDVYVTLKEEPVKQFKAFTFSHIRNVLESDDPSVQRYSHYTHILQLIKSINWQIKFADSELSIYNLLS